VWGWQVSLGRGYFDSSGLRRWRILQILKNLRLLGHGMCYGTRVSKVCQLQWVLGIRGAED
jgi:hypothetical protein